MNVFVIFSFIALGITAFVIQKKRRFNNIDAVHLLFFAALSELLKSGFDEGLGDVNGANVWSYSLITLLAANFLLSRWSKLRKPIVRLIPPIISFGIFVVLFWNESFVYLGENFNVSDKATWVLPLIGVVMYEFVIVKMSFLKRFFGLKDSSLNVLLTFLVGVSIVIGAFNAQGYGVFMVSAGFLAASFYREGNKHVLHSLFAVALVWMFADQNSIELIDLRFPKVMGGLFVGAFAGAFIQHIWTAEKRPNLALIMGYFIAALFFLGLLTFKALINASFGGMEAFLGGMVGYAIANAILDYENSDETQSHAPTMMSGLVMIILIGLIVPPMLVNEEEKAIEETLDAIVPKNEKGEVIEVPFLSFKDLSGSYGVDPSTSLVSFKLGPDGSVTKGAIKEFTGKFNFGEDLLKTTFDIKMPVINLTTFIGMRDESIMGKDYFNQANFPMMRFSGSEMSTTDKENEFEMIGKFEMLGIQKDQKVRIHRIEEGAKIVLVGSGQIDRTRFGMADDPREGNIVAFEFKVELTK